MQGGIWRVALNTVRISTDSYARGLGEQWRDGIRRTDTTDGQGKGQDVFSIRRLRSRPNSLKVCFLNK